MTYKILKTFADKYTGQVYKQGETADFTEERAKEILAKDKFISAVRKKK